MVVILAFSYIGSTGTRVFWPGGVFLVLGSGSGTEELGEALHYMCDQQ